MLTTPDPCIRPFSSASGLPTYQDVFARAKKSSLRTNPDSGGTRQPQHALENGQMQGSDVKISEATGEGTLGLILKAGAKVSAV